jgi:hypothetical protein
MRKRNSMKQNEETEVVEASEPVTVDAPVAQATGETRPVSAWKTNEAKHAAAASLHRWGLYAHHNNQEMRLTKEDYEASILAASKRSAGKYKPHAPALFAKKVK